MNEYKTKQLFNRKNRKYSDDFNHQNISAHEIFINDEDAVVIWIVRVSKILEI